MSLAIHAGLPKAEAKKPGAGISRPVRGANQAKLAHDGAM